MPSDRFKLVDRKSLCLPLLALLLAGCGGGGDDDFVGIPGEVSGLVFDTDGDVVRDARVFTTSPDRETRSNSAGSYVLTDVPSDDLLVHAEVTQDGTRYVGQNLARVFENDRAKNVNIVVVPENRTARIRGRVRLDSGEIVEGARVFAIGENNLSSSMAITDRDGDYEISLLSPDVDYIVLANTPGATADAKLINLDPGETDTVNLVMVESGSIPLGPPSNLTAVAWTSPFIETDRSTTSSAMEAIKREFDPERATRATLTRQTISGNLVEVDLSWDPIVSDFILGYGIWRGPGGTSPSPVDFLRDPMAEFFADADDDLIENQVYTYGVTSVNSDQDESGLSNLVTVETLGRVRALSPGRDPLRFRWEGALGADQYIVYLFEDEPKVGVSSIWNNEDNPTFGTQYEYTGPSLVSGRTYYFVVLGISNDGESRTISQVVPFVAN
jgi:hypothetical protein